MNEFQRMLAKWGFGTPKSSDGGRRIADPPAPRDPYRDVEQVKELLASGVTPQMLFEHPFIKLTADARKYLENQ